METMMEIPKAHSLSHFRFKVLDSNRHKPMQAAEMPTRIAWMLDLGSSATVSAAKAPSRAAVGISAIIAGLRLDIEAPPFFISGVKIKVEIIHIAPDRLMAMKATPKTCWV